MGNMHQKERKSTSNVYEPSTELQAEAHVKSRDQYEQIYNESIEKTDKFWLNIAQELHFEEFSGNGLEYNFDMRKGPIFTRFLAGSRTNIAYNCLERVIASGKRDKIAYKWIGNEPGDEKTMTYKELHALVVNFSAVLRAKGVKKGDVVAIYLPMIPEIAVAMLACARIGAPHSVVFGGFSAESLSQRILQAKSKVLITADGVFRGPKLVPLKQIADHAIEMCQEAEHKVETQIVVEHLHRVKSSDQSSLSVINWKPIDCKWDEEMTKSQQVDSPVEWMDAEDPLFVLYTSGSTGVPKGILHSTAGYMTYAYATMKYVFDVQEDDVYWCTADCGWITGHTYLLYGPLLNSTTSVFFEGIPTYPNAGRIWETVEKCGVSKLYVSSTAVRALMAFPEHHVTKWDRSSLKIIGTVGEPINSTAWLWLYEVVSERKAAIIDTYWQTETGGHVVAPLPGAIPTKPGSATLPFFGIQPVLLDNDGKEVKGEGEGNLCFATSWPGASRSILDDYGRFEKTYFNRFPGYYFTGDGAKRDKDGYYWITGRVDELMNAYGQQFEGLAGDETQKTPETNVLSPKRKRKSKYGYPSTPPHYWDVDFPTPEQQKNLGLIVESDSPLFKKKRIK